MDSGRRALGMTPMTALRLGTRGSRLALWQAQFVADALAAGGGPVSEVVAIKTSGDRLAEGALRAIGGKQLFVKEIEDALLSGQIDLAVHSAKDLPADLPDGAALAAVPVREDPRDAIVLADLADAPGGPGEQLAAPGQDGREVIARLVAQASATRFGTGSVRRVAQLRQLFPHARFEGIRGNLETRLRKLDAGGPYDALILAAAGLKRLGFGARISTTLSPSTCVPAPGQGAIAVEIRADDASARRIVERIADAAAIAAVAAERALVAALGGSCQVPIGALATLAGGELRLDAIVTSLNGRRSVRHSGTGAIDDPITLGRKVADLLLESGAGEILEDVRQEQIPAKESP